MKIRPKQAPAMFAVPALLAFSTTLAILALAALTARAAAEEPAQEATGEDSAERPKNLLRWSTATETDNFGYDIYRGESADGPFERLNEDPIPGAGTTDKRTAYEFVDDEIEPGKTYWYYLESISMSGVRERFTPVFRKDPEPKQASADIEDKGEGDPGR